MPENLTVAQIKELAQQSEISVVNQEREQEIKDYIDQIKRGRHTGGVVETVVGGVPCWSWFLCAMGYKTCARLLKQLYPSMPQGMWNLVLVSKMATLKGSQVMDEILWNEEDGYIRRTNNLGGF